MATDRHERWLYAHRGAAAELPENTLEAFARALEIEGVSAIETDIHLTRDEHVVISHDDTGERCGGVKATIAKSTLAEVRSWDVGQGLRMPTFEEALEAFPQARFNVDLKPCDVRLVRSAVDIVRRASATDRVLLTSVHGCVVRRLRREGYEGNIGLGAGQIISLLLMPGPLGRLLRLPGTAAQVPVRYGPIKLATRRRIRAFHELGLRVDFWTIDDPDEAVRLLELGADGIMTDDPARVAPAFLAATRG